MTDLRKIPGYPNYRAGADGCVYRVIRGKRSLNYPLKRVGHPGSYGYLMVCLRRGEAVAVHRVIAEAFLGSKPKWADQVRHLNGDKLDNRPGNLAWGTFTENEADKLRHGTGNGGTRNGRAVLNERAVRELRLLRRVGATYASLAARYGIAETTARVAATGGTWAKLAAVVVCAALAGCASGVTVTADPRAFCPAITEVTVSKADRLTEGTASQIEANNLARRSLCDGAPPPPPAPGKREMPVS